MKILHFYHDLMNLYGDYANVSAMRRILEKSGESVTVDRRSLGDNVDFSDYDFIYIGSGTERNQRVALADLHRHADALRQYIADGRPALMSAPCTSWTKSLRGTTILLSAPCCTRFSKGLSSRIWGSS